MDARGQSPDSPWKMGSYRILRTTDDAEWRDYLSRIGRKDLVHHPQYSEVYERYGDGAAECFTFIEGDSVLVYPFIRRAIDAAGDAKPPLSDIITPYGYGGFVYECRGSVAPASFLTAFREAFSDHASSTGIVSEFIRFHPCLANHEHCLSLLDSVSLHCNNALIDLSIGKDALFRQYRTTWRRYIRQAVRHELKVELIDNDSFIDPFFAQYSAGMARKHQEGYYNFKRNFLEIIHKELGRNLLFFSVKNEADTIAGALFLRYGAYLDYFLAASRPECLPLRPNHLLIHEVACWAIDNGIEHFHLGGGHESLLFFKHGFANQSRPYYIGRHIHDRAAYERLSTDHWQRHGLRWTGQSRFFPAYRADLSTP